MTQSLMSEAKVKAKVRARPRPRAKARPRPRVRPLVEAQHKAIVAADGMGWDGEALQGT